MGPQPKGQDKERNVGFVLWRPVVPKDGGGSRQPGPLPHPLLAALAAWLFLCFCVCVFCFCFVGVRRKKSVSFLFFSEVPKD